MNRVLIILLLSVPLILAADRGFVPARRAAGDHVALIIGNGAYPDVPLANPVNDAVDMGKAFEAIGFQVTVVSDADKAQMLQAIGAFGDRLPKAKAALFYYAGHGVQVGGTNWLMPVARQVTEIINREDEVRLRAVDANEVLVAMERAKVPVSMVILDACRNNPFKGSGRSGVKGLAQLDAPPGSLVVYATAPGQVAADGNGRNSPFSQAFLAQLLIAGQDVDTMLRNVKRAVRDTTGGVQIPWSSSSMTDVFAFVPAMTADEERELKAIQLKELQNQDAAIQAAEALAAKRRADDEAALVLKQAEIDQLNAKIEEMKKKAKESSGPGATGDSTGLKAMLAVVRQKEAQQKELNQMQKKADEARQAREAEIAAMKAADQRAWREREDKRLAELEGDLKDYREIASSDFGKEMAQGAWDEVLKKWGLQPGSFPRDDVSGLKAKAAPGLAAETAASVAAAKEEQDLANAALARGLRVDLEAFLVRFPNSPRASDIRAALSLSPAWASETGRDTMGAWAKFRVGTQVQTMRYIQGGTYDMGSTNGDLDEKPVHPVVLSSFWMGDSEVTQGLWKAVMGSNPSEDSGTDQPVERVRWTDCGSFFSRLNEQVKGLEPGFPTEAQWEYACRAGTTGDHAGDLAAMGWFDGNSGKETHPVKAKKPNAWGLYDMHGNVYEWCADGLGDYPRVAQVNPLRPASGSAVYRGGCWRDSASRARSANRDGSQISFSSGYVGVRLCAPVQP